jgi:peptidoglycan/LPS O-acetylase OafA/YrhL
VARFMQRMSYDTSEHWFLFGLISLVLTLTAATGSYWVMERPIMNWTSRHFRRVGL